MIKWSLTLFLSILTSLALVQALTFLGGCATPIPVIENHQLYKQDLYQISSLSNAWLRAPTRIYERWGDSFIYLDAVYLKCPGGHSVYITTAMLRGKVHKLSRGLFFWNQNTFEERVVAFYEDNHPSLKQVLSHRTIQVGRYEGVEVVYLTKDNKERLGAFCTTGKAEEEPLRTKDIVIDAGSSIGLGSGPEILILSYASPPETFDDEVAEFDKMVQTFQLLRQK